MAAYTVETDDDVMTVEEFKESCSCGAFIDYDGFGYAIRGDTSVADSDTVVIPSEASSIPEDVTHVVWFNR